MDGLETEPREENLDNVDRPNEMRPFSHLSIEAFLANEGEFIAEHERPVGVLDQLASIISIAVDNRINDAD